MELLMNQPDAPHQDRTVLVAPGRRVALAQAGHPLVRITPRTRLGAVALNLAVASSSATIQIVATTAYVNALTALATPNITFQAPPPGTTIPVDSLQSAFDTFRQQLSTVQGQAALWVTSQPTGGASIFSNLVTVAQTLISLDSTVQGDFAILQNTTPGSPLYNTTLSQVTALIKAEATPLSNLYSQLQSLGSQLGSASTMLTTAAGTGVLAQLQAAYQSEITALNQAIANCNSTISSDNKKIIGLGFAVGAAIVVAELGLVNIWNPLGWVMIGGGIAGAYFALAEITTLKGQIATLRAEIEADTNWADSDQAAAQSVAAFAGCVSAAASMNSATQQELGTLQALCQSISNDIATAVKDLTPQELSAAIAEWTAIVQQANFLSAITAYIWPSPVMLANPTNLTISGPSARLVVNSGQVYQYTASASAWTTLPGYSLSVVSAGAIVAGIDGAPNDGAQIQPNPYGQTFFAKTLSSDGTAWQTISDFPVAQLCTDGTSIYAISQLTSDRQIHSYGGTGTAWTAMTALPGGDAPAAIAAAGGRLVAIGNNSHQAWFYGASNWYPIGDAANYVSLTAAGRYCGLLDNTGCCWLLDLNNAALTAMMKGVTTLAQAADGSQYVTDQQLNLWHVPAPAPGTQYPTPVQLMSNVVSVATSAEGAVYLINNTGNISIQTDAVNNTWQMLPALPAAAPTAPSRDVAGASGGEPTAAIAAACPVAI